MADMNEQFDLDLLKKLGLVPPAIGEANLQPSPFPVIDTGPHFGPVMEAELGAPYAMLTRPNMEPPDTPAQVAPRPSVGKSSLPWTMADETVTQIPIESRGVQRSVTTPEGTAAWTPGTPDALQTWIQQKQAEQAANREASGRRAEVQARLEIYRQRQVEREQQMAREQQMNQHLVLQELARTNPKLFLEQVAKMQTTRATADLARNRAEGAGTAEAQAFRQIAEKQGLEAALTWLNTQQKTGGPLTPEQRYANTLAETMARYGPIAQQLRGASAAAAAGGRAEALSEANRSLPVMAKHGNWINPNTGEFAKETDTPDQLVARGFKYVDDKARQATASARAALAQIRQYRQLAQSLLPDYIEGDTTGNLWRVQTNRGALALKRWSGHPLAQRLEGMYGTIAAIARATGDTANIAVAEREMLHNSVVVPGDTKQSAIAKLDQLQAILEDVQRGWGTTAAYERETGQGTTVSPNGQWSIKRRGR